MELAQEEFKMKKRLWVLFATLTLFVIFTSSVFASSTYVLPYPSGMPGSFLYKPRLIFEKVAQLWYFGNFGQFTYNLKQSDRYLVQAKTLFEYKQYLLAYNALKKSDAYFIKTIPNLEKAKTEGKNIHQNRETLSSAAEKHTEILAEIKKIVPDKFNWQPEKSVSTMLDLKSAIESSIVLRRKYL